MLKSLISRRLISSTARTRTFKMTTSPIRSPPAKRLKQELPADFTHITEAPVNALFTEPSKSQQPKKQTKRDRRKGRKPLPEPFSPADVMWHDVRDFLGRDYVDEVLGKKDGSEWEAPNELGSFAVVELSAGAFTVSGESLSLFQSGDKKWAIITPFAHPGDRIRAKIYKHDRLHCLADLVEIFEYSDTYRGGEGDRRVNPDGGCKYFGECGGCQLQPVPYHLQLQHKLRTVQLAYERFSTLPSSLVPTILPTIGSPKQWGYRTKITPHFDAPPKWAKEKLTKLQTEAASTGEEEALNAEDEARKGWECRVGFERKGKPGVMDIEECPIATPVLNTQLTLSRAQVKSSIMSYKKGATILLRDALPEPNPLPTAENPWNVQEAGEEQHIAVTDHKAQVYERVGPWLFSFTAGSFFQNNNSILIPLTTYVQEAIFPPNAKPNLPRPTHLVDTYCGSGLFGVTLSPSFTAVAGVEISSISIEAAKRNAEMNGLKDKTTWLCGKAEDIFGGLAEQGFAGRHSCVVVDPPRKGCDTPFLDQLLNFRPLTIVYVSCNVHTQARDVGYLVHESNKRGQASQGKEEAMKGWKYTVESLRGFDLFPQTAHVESVAVLRLEEQ
ncbi:tRNA (uracil-5-)-methyltransferase [Cryptococcus gattii E566]|uniref:tRNA (Uracil-5-)-methyltransferase n=1 Tax=Cryptococcus gattii EJB2 TaxID=1296103 RepID=A0ABR5BY04_9TREE|nr:tRNA (uracil-5-)-methyltransferase [Cryptococcus gattii EJB2]KIY31401.1 tRNA (uracil-5-)-methyltransferase [Cryptococcus gattii E566]KJE01301.1 tRNA (uracil-5-)-methyltransferase [Cryptococcus gattii NT-10]